MTAHGLIDTTEMYLRTIFELEEEGITALRARIAERLSQSGPTVSQTVARMERDDLLQVKDGRQLSQELEALVRRQRRAEFLRHLLGPFRLAFQVERSDSARQINQSRGGSPKQV